MFIAFNMCSEAPYYIPFCLRRSFSLLGGDAGVVQH